MLDRLLSSLYSAFDKDPEAQIVLRMRHPDGATWKVADRILTMGTEAGATLAIIGLQGKKLFEVAAELVALGYDMVFLNEQFAQRAADTLLDGAGRQSQSNGDALRSFDSMLWALLDAQAVELEGADANVVAAIRQLYLGQAEGEFADVWGEYFGQLRREGESDEAYRVRIIVETLRPRVTRRAIERAVREDAGREVTLYEPWRNMFELNTSALSGADHMRDGTYWTHNVIQPVAKTSFDWRHALAIIERSRAAGVIVAPPVFKPVLVASSDIVATGAVKTGREETRSMAAHVERTGRLNYFALGDAGEVRRNYKISMAQLISLRTTSPLANPASFDASRRNIRRANIVLSDSDPIGSMNAVFQRSYWIQPKDRPVMNSMRLSGYDGRIRLGMVDEIRSLFAAALSFTDFGGAVAYSGIEEIRSSGPLEIKAPTEQPRVAIEATRASLEEFDKVMNPAPYLWGFDGYGAWNQDEGAGWSEDHSWGNGMRQS